MTITDASPARTTAPTPEELTRRVSDIAGRIAPGAADSDATGVIRRDVFDELRVAGVTSALVPRDHGGAGITHTQMGKLITILAAADPAVGLTLSMHAHLVAAQVWRHNHGQDASGVFAKVAGGALLISTGASDWLGSTGSATAVDGGFRISARKAPASGCEVGDVLVTSIRWDDAPDGPQVLHCAVPFSADGVSIEQTWDAVGMRATGSHTVVLDDVFVPDATVALVRPADVWHPVWSTVLGAAMPLIMAAYVGIADAAVAEALSAARGGGDRNETLVGEMLNAYQCGADAVAMMFASSENLNFANTEEHAAVTLSRKTNASEAFIETVRLAIEVVGGGAYSNSSLLGRLHRDVHAAIFHPLPRAKQLPFTGRVALA